MAGTDVFNKLEAGEGVGGGGFRGSKDDVLMA